MLSRERGIIEHHRREIEQSDPYQTDAAQWEEALNRISGATSRRDVSLQEAFNQAAFGSRRQRSRAEDRLRELDEDISWAQQRLSDLAHLQHMGGGPADLSQHQHLLNLHLLGRQARRAEVELEIGAGRLDEQQWNTAWAELMRAWDAQAAAVNQGRAGARSLTDQRLQSLRGLHDTQVKAYSSMSEGAGRVLLLDQMKVVEGAINYYNPPRATTSVGSTGAGVAFLVVIIFIGAMLAGSRPGGGASGATSPYELTPIVELPTIPAGPGPAADIQAAPSATPVPIPTSQITDLVPLPASDLIARGLESRRAGQYAYAVSLFEQAIATDPALSAGYTQLAFCLYELGRFDEAIRHWNEAVRLAPGDADALAGLGVALYARGDQALGLARYREALGIEPRYGDEAFLQAEQAWSEGAIVASRPLRAAPAP